MLPSEMSPEWQLKVVANLEYLDVGVALAIWDSWKLTELFNRLLPRGAETVPSALVIASLVIQRCIAPGSKLYAQRWFPTTALPELLKWRRRSADMLGIGILLNVSLRRFMF